MINAKSLAASAILGAALTSLPMAPVYAADLGGIDVVPTTGNALSLISIVTERGCSEPAERVSAVLKGKGLPAEGQIIVAPNEVLFSTTRPMELPLSNAFVVYADRNGTALSGKYTVTVRCTDRIGVNVIDEFSTTMTWKTPGGSASNVEKATFTAVSSAGVVEEATDEPGDKPDAPTTGSDGATAPSDGAQGREATDEPASPVSPGEQPLANDELPDGSNPDAARTADDVTASTAADASTPWNAVFLGGAALALLAGAWLLFRGSRDPA
jgi:hypothetical protein